jgi:L-serine dehydratase
MLPPNLSVFDVIGPVMVGPSSSHTAGAARIGLIARQLLGEEPRKASFGVYGSFAATGKGHATDRALVAGLLGEQSDSEQLPHALETAAAKGMIVSFTTCPSDEDTHPNTVDLELEGERDRITLRAASLGGGVIVISMIDGHRVSLGGLRPTFVSWHEDRPGFLAGLTKAMANLEINIATLATTRKTRGGSALTVVEIDGPPPPAINPILGSLPGLQKLRLIPALP